MPTKALILDIAMNLNRIGNWAADNYDGKEKRIVLFLNQINQYLQLINREELPQSFLRTFDRFTVDFNNLGKKPKKNDVDILVWAEALMTWGNILTHRSKFLR